MSKKYIPEGSWLACDKGTCPSSFRISNNNNTNIYGSKLASEADLLPYLNIKPMGFCSASFRFCMPAVLKWDNPQEGVTVNNFRLLKEDSTCQCMVGGKIKIYFDRGSAAANCVFGEIKMPTEYIKEGFDWMAEQNAKSREARDSMLPDWMGNVTGVTDWFEDLGSGLVEGAVNGVVGMAEGVYQIAQDPVGTAEAIGGMVGDGYDSAKEGLTNAAEWASDGDNWSDAYDATKSWVSDSNNWKEAANSAWEGTKDAASWVAENPRKIGTSVGQFIPDVAAAVYTAGGSAAGTAARVAAKETAELAGEAAARQLAKETAEQLAKKEAARLGAKAFAGEVDDVVGKVVVKSEKELAEEAIADVEKGVTKLEDYGEKKGNFTRKGNYGEMKADQHFENLQDINGNKADLKRISKDRATGIDDAGHTGIDGVYENANPPPKYIVNETKYGSSGLNPKTADGRQMSDPWVDNRLENAVGKDAAEKIRDEEFNNPGSVQKVLTKVDADGNVTTYKVDPKGKVTGPWP